MPPLREHPVTVCQVPNVPQITNRAHEKITGLIGRVVSILMTLFATETRDLPFNRRERARLAQSRRRHAVREIDCYRDVADEARACRVVGKR
jgi:hypothetical protein